MDKGIIGYTGFVGGNLVEQTEFAEKYNSQNISDVDGKEFDLLICAGARAEKWRINQEPEKDLAEIDGLIDHLRTVKATKFVLISTVDVYGSPVGVDEDTPIETEGLHAYGKNRYYLEQFCAENFDTTIIRLPGLFGNGLKKNVIYDLLYNNNVDRIHHAGSFQYYNLDYIWRDIQVAIENDLGLINFASEPVRTDEIAKEAFGVEFTNEPEGVAAGSYDMRSKHASLWGKQGSYLYTKAEELADIKSFVERQKAEGK